MMNYAHIKSLDMADGVGCRTALFVSGCTHHCKGCFNEVAWSFDYGKPFTEEIQDVLMFESNKSFIDGITILGGEPMEPQNQSALLPFLERFRRELPDKTIWIYSGYTWEQLHDVNARCYSDETEQILALIDVLVDGEFVLEKKDITLRFRGSSNQRIIDVPASIKSGEVVISDYQKNERRKGAVV